MNDLQKYKQTFIDFQLCIIIPTYNNSKTLKQVINDVLTFSENILVVNDGSTDDTVNILQSIKDITILSIPKNSGKGNALRMGFIKAREMGFIRAITIDSDGQHFAKDIPAFLDKIKENPNAIIIGSRNMNQSAVPGKSNFGYRISNYWFKVETGIKAPDTQSGYRHYPIALLKNINYRSEKFEFELEVLVRSSWSGIPVTSVPITVYYAPGKERVSHFRPVKDFTRIGLMHAVFVVISFLYIKPRDYFRNLFQNGNLRSNLKNQLLNEHESDFLKSVSIGFGIFMGIVPIWGFQMLVAIFVAIMLRLNKALVIIAANISIPPMIPLILYLSFKTGAICMGKNATDLFFSKQITLETVRAHGQQYLYGSIVLALVAGIISGLISYLSLKIFKRKISEVN